MKASTLVHYAFQRYQFTSGNFSQTCRYTQNTYQIFFFISRRNDTAHLDFYGVTLDDMGSYFCRAKNPYGQHHEKVSLLGKCEVLSFQSWSFVLFGPRVTHASKEDIFVQ